MKLTSTCNRLIFNTVMAATLTVVFAHPAFAQTTIDLAVSPPTAYMKVKQGSSATHTIVIENLSDQQLKLTPRIVDFKSDNTSGTPVLSDESSFPYFDFDATSLEQLTLPAKGKAQLTLRMSVPSGVPNQEFPMTVLFESQPDTDFSAAASDSQVRGMIGSNLILLVSGDAQVPSNLAVNDFKTSGIIDSFRPLKFTPVVTNTGYGATAASGSAQILNWRGKVVKEYQIKPVVILGNSSRELETTLSGEPLPTLDNPEAAEKILFTKQFIYKPLLLLGIYKISLDLSVQNQAEINHIIQTKTVLAVPLSILAVVLLIPGCWWVYIYFLRKKDSQ